MPSWKRIDGRAHHRQFADLELTGDARTRRHRRGACSMTTLKGRRRLTLAIRSDLTLQQQVTAPGATWLDRQLLASGEAARDRERRTFRRRGAWMPWTVDSSISPPRGIARRHGPAGYLLRAICSIPCRRRELSDGGRENRRWAQGLSDSTVERKVVSRSPSLYRQADRVELGPLCDDRRWPRLPARALASGPGAAARSPGLRRHDARRRCRLELRSKARARALTARSHGLRR